MFCLVCGGLASEFGGFCIINCTVRRGDRRMIRGDSCGGQLIHAKSRVRPRMPCRGLGGEGPMSWLMPDR